MKHFLQANSRKFCPDEARAATCPSWTRGQSPRRAVFLVHRRHAPAWAPVLCLILEKPLSRHWKLLRFQMQGVIWGNPVHCSTASRLTKPLSEMLQTQSLLHPSSPDTL